MSAPRGSVSQPRTATGAAANPQATPQGLQQAHFIQRKFKNLYDKTYSYLAPRGEAIEKLESVLVWKEPLVSAALYISVHWIFIVFAQTNYSFATRTGNCLFWIIIGDVLWRAATNQFGNAKSTSVPIRRPSSDIGKKKKPVSFENAVIKRSTPLRAEEFPALEVICLWIAEILMWLDNFFIALRHWSVNEPYLFSACLLCPGLFLSLLGKYVPTMVVAYVAVIALLTWPYIEYHGLGSKVNAHVQTRFPQAMDKARSLWVRLKKFASKDQTEFPEVALHSQGDEAGVEQSLQEAFEHITSPSTTTSTTGTTTKKKLNVQPRPPLGRPHPHANSGVNPGASVLDSVLGLHPNAFQGPDDSLGDLSSMSLGPGEGFPSITNFDDESLTLSPRVSDQGLSTMPSINEEDDFGLERANSRDLDPFLDSIEVEYGGFNFTDGKPRPSTTNPSHPLSHSQTRPPMTQQHGDARLDRITEEPHADIFGSGQTGFDTGYETTGLRDHTHQGGYAQHQSGYGDTYYPPPPPKYQAAVDGSDGGIKAGTNREIFDDGGRWADGDDMADAGGGADLPVETMGSESGRYWLRQRHN